MFKTIVPEQNNERSLFEPEANFRDCFLLIQFDNRRETVLETNVSNWCIGGMLFQYISGIFRPYVYYLKRTSPADCNYKIYDKKMLAIIRCFEKFRKRKFRNCIQQNSFCKKNKRQGVIDHRNRIGKKFRPSYNLKRQFRRLFIY